MNFDDKWRVFKRAMQVFALVCAVAALAWGLWAIYQLGFES